ncbi:MAG: serine kinase [Armatimonadota bacterium]
MSELAKSLNLAPRTVGPDAEVTGGYSSDLLSDVLGNAKVGNVWVTNQKHQNCVAVASLLGLAGVIVAGGAEPDPGMIEKAEAEEVSLYTTELSAFETAGRLYALGVR